MGQQLQVRVPMRADGPARESGGVGKRIVELRGNPGASLPTVPVFGEKKPFLPRPARERASVGTDGRRIRRSAAPALPTVPDFGAARHSFYRRSRFFAQPFTCCFILCDERVFAIIFA